MLRLAIASDPPVHFYKHPDALASIPAGERALQLLLNVGDIDASIEDLNPDLQIVLDNAAGQCADLFYRLPPLDAPAVLYDGSVELFAGVVDSLSLGLNCTIKVIA